MEEFEELAERHGLTTKEKAKMVVKYCGKDNKFRGESGLRVFVVEGPKISIIFLCCVTFTTLAYVISKSVFAN